MADREFRLKILADVDDVRKGVQRVERQAESFGKTAKRIAIGIGTAFAVDRLVDFGREAINAASDLEQAAGASQSVFGAFADDLDRFGDTTAENFGIAKSEFLQLSSLTGSLLKNAGVPLAETADLTKVLTERAADLAATYGGDVDQALGAVNSALKGELDPLENFGVSLRASAIEARAAADGYVDADGKVTDYGKSMAAVSLILEQSSDAQGQFARESDTVAGRSAILRAQFTDLQAELGTKLLPVVAAFTEQLIRLVDFVDRNSDWLIPLAGGIAAVVVAVKAWTLAQAALNVVLSLNPVGAVIVGVVALGAAIVAVVKNWDTITDAVRNFVESAGRFLGDLVNTLWNVGGRIFELWTYPYRLAWEYVSGIFTSITSWIWEFPGLLNSAWSGLWNVITYPFRIAFDAIRNWWNSTVGGFGFTAPTWLPFGVGGRRFEIPRMAAGGIVTGPTLALIGEAGPEAVIPLDRMAAAQPVVVNVYALNANYETGRLVANALDEYRRLAG